MRVQGVRAVVDAGIAVMGHTGLMPQTISVMGGFRPQAQSAASALSVLRDAKVSAQWSLLGMGGWMQNP